jgi:hypothetical protein
MPPRLYFTKEYVPCGRDWLLAVFSYTWRDILPKAMFNWANSKAVLCIYIGG